MYVVIMYEMISMMLHVSIMLCINDVCDDVNDVCNDHVCDYVKDVCDDVTDICNDHVCDDVTDICNDHVCDDVSDVCDDVNDVMYINDVNTYLLNSYKYH
ncbi:hypothetical protein CDAR_19721 [Caerostris darwini]|uniref:Uncharacterized protein n=1 Tax=Caerostris darwini TaxID=1538125 RepID=A0AAV4TI15_9ARAC|nr:hypothetical protein CDAR_19721 [Caerostris darwini]